MLRAIVGLGNPGPEHASDRHNAGFWLLDALAQSGRVQFHPERKFNGDLARLTLAGQDLLLLKPASFMNRSGQAVQALMAFYKLSPPEILVAHDELDLPPGTARLKLGGGHGGHNGLRSLHEHIGPEYARLRIGIGHPGHKDRVHDYVLSRPTAEQKLAMDDALTRSLEMLPVLLNESWDKATLQLHTEI
ncbi:MAG: aminoacyl-tRNA hydrolase [Nevskiales bacterium]